MLTPSKPLGLFISGRQIDRKIDSYFTHARKPIEIFWNNLFDKDIECCNQVVNLNINNSFVHFPEIIITIIIILRREAAALPPLYEQEQNNNNDK